MNVPRDADSPDSFEPHRDWTPEREDQESSESQARQQLLAERSQRHMQMSSWLEQAEMGLDDVEAAADTYVHLKAEYKRELQQHPVHGSRRSDQLEEILPGMLRDLQRRVYPIVDRFHKLADTYVSQVRSIGGGSRLVPETVLALQAKVEYVAGVAGIHVRTIFIADPLDGK